MFTKLTVSDKIKIIGDENNVHIQFMAKKVALLFRLLAYYDLVNIYEKEKI